MKSCKFFLAVLFSLLFINSNAQLFVGGNIRFNISNGKTESGTATINQATNYNFDFSPKIGNFLSDKLAVGIALDLSLTGNKTTVNTESLSRSSAIGISPFLRFYAIKWNKFSVFGQGNIGLTFSRSSVKIGGSTSDGPKTTNAYVNVYPGISYDISDKLSLETGLNFLSFGYNYLSSKNGSTTERTSNFNIGAGLDNIVSVGNITIGAIYKF